MWFVVLVVVQCVEVDDLEMFVQYCCEVEEVLGFQVVGEVVVQQQGWVVVFDLVVDFVVVVEGKGYVYVCRVGQVGLVFFVGQFFVVVCQYFV